MKWMWKQLALLGALGLTAGGAVGCATERPPINRVQADALAKSFFVGDDLEGTQDDPEFFARTTIIDVGYGAAQDGLYTSTGAQPISRIRWQITEDSLIARLSYERIANTDGKGDLTDGISYKPTEDGQVVAAYKIESHFDIARDYNPTTGEEQNVIVENSTDRPWNQREYFRVDWSSNLITDQYDFDLLSIMGFGGAVTFEPFAYTVLDPNDPNAPHFDSDAGYFDVTNKVYATPNEVDLSSLGWGISTVPACAIDGLVAGGTAPAANCGPMEVTLRQSYKRVVDTDYQPVDYDGFRFGAFGIFTNERMGYDRNYGIVDGQTHHYASRYNIWDRSHFYKDPEGMTGPVACAVTPVANQTGQIDPFGNPNVDANNDGTADACTGAGFGSQCDVFTQKCTLPYELRQAVTIPWYVNGVGIDPATGLTNPVANNAAALATAEQTAEDLFEATDWAVQEWDLAMKAAVQTARYTECMATNGANCPQVCPAGSSCASVCAGGDARAICAGLYPMWHGQQEDMDDAINIARDLSQCHRTSGWSSQTCTDLVTSEAKAYANERGDSTDYDAFAIGAVNNLEPVIVLCHNPVTAKDHPSCGPEGLAPRLGDIRYNNILTVDKPQTPSPWGIMVDADDPLTGEKVAASVNIWSHVTDLASQGLVDLVKYINGEITTADITDGTYIDNWVQAQKVNGGGMGMKTMSKDERDMRLAGAAHVSLDTYRAARNIPLPAGLGAKIAEHVTPMIMGTNANANVPSSANSVAANRMAGARASDVETELVNKPMLQSAGIYGQSTGLPTDPQTLDQVSPLAMNNPRIRSQFAALRENAFASRGTCVIDEAPEPSSLPAIAQIMATKFPRVYKDTNGDGQITPTDSNGDGVISEVPVYEICPATPPQGFTCGDVTVPNPDPNSMSTTTNTSNVILCDSNGACPNAANGAAGTCNKSNNACVVYDTDYESLTDQYNRWNQMQRYIRRKYHYAVIIHEMGHSIGMRHNFISTAAALHYRPQYWQLRTSNGDPSVVNNECQDQQDKTGAAKCVGPRYFDPLTDEENSQLIWMFGQSSVMDYPGDNSQDTLGLGVYDFAAARMFYGDVVSVYDIDGGWMPTTGVPPAADFAAGGRLGIGITSSTDSIGGLLGIQYQIHSGAAIGGTEEATRCQTFSGGPCQIHYSQLQRYFSVIHDCYPATIAAAAVVPGDPSQQGLVTGTPGAAGGPPKWWDPTKDGVYHSVFDGHVVSVNGQATKCRTLPVDYTQWNRLRAPSDGSNGTADETGGGFYQGNNSVEPGTGRQRVPYSFATDEWADTGNASVFRFDSGADTFEEANFVMNLQEDRHILDNYRRSRATFNVRASADRSYSRYNEKLYGIANGVGFYGNIYKDFLENGGVFTGGQGTPFDTFWPVVVNGQLPDNMLAASVAFDAFTRQLSRPEPGGHYAMAAAYNDPTLRSVSDSDGNPGTSIVTVPNGSAGYYQDVSFGGHPLENALEEGQGFNYATEYPLNAGSYYDKINAAILLSLSEDNFISQSRQDFYDARYRSVGMADIFPEGWARVIGNALTQDRSLMAPRITATGGVPDTNGDPRDPSSNQFPKNAIGWTSWWPPQGPSVCFPTNGANVCQGYTGSTDSTAFTPFKPASSVGVDPEIGWEVQKFLIAWTLAYIPADQQTNWIDMLRLYRAGENSDPVFADRVEWQDPVSGEFFYAKSYGHECLFGSSAVPPTDLATCTAASGKWVEKGIAARVLEYNPATVNYPAGFNDVGRAMFVIQPGGDAVVAGDPALIDSTTGAATKTCDQNVDPTCTPLSIYGNHFAYQLQGYKEVPDFLWEVVLKYGLGTPDELGVYGVSGPTM
jgi:hypothetical protein